MSKQSKPTTTDTSTWTCQTCEGQPQFEHAAFVDHMNTVHAAPANAQGTRRMLMHMDGTNWFGGSDEWTFDFGAGVIVAVNSYRYKRSKEQQAYWGEDMP